MSQSDGIKKQLLKQAKDKISTAKEIKNLIKPLTKLASTQDDTGHEFVAEARTRLERIKEANLEKQSMAQTTGTGGFQRSWNIEYSMRDLSSREKEIKNTIETQYAPYMYEEIREKGISERKVELPAGIYGQPQGNALELTGSLGDPDIPDATLVMRFDFERKVIPIEQENPEAHNKAMDGIRVIDEIAPGFSDLVNSIEASNIPLNPFFHTSSFGLSQGGGINAKSLKPFIESERNRASRQGLNVYREHVQALSERGGSHRALVQDTGQGRNLKTPDLFSITHTAYLGDALVGKVKDGYVLDVDALTTDIKQLRDMWLDRLGITGDPNNWTRRERDYVRSQNKHYNQMAKRIISYFNNGCAWQAGKPEHGRFTIVEQPEQGRFKGLPGWENVTSKHIKCPMLRITEWHLLVKNCTKSISANHQLGPDDYYIPSYNITHKPNGMDFAPSGMSRMLVTPPLRGLPPTNNSPVDQNGDPIVRLMYDRDNGNIGRDHLVKNWRSPSGGLQQLFANGEEYQTMLLALRNTQIRNQLPPHVQMAWDAVFTNRTSAEAAFDTSRKYNNYNELYMDYLRNSYATERKQYNNALKNDIPGDPITEAAKQYRIDGNWNNFTRVLSDGLAASDRQHMMLPGDFSAYQQYVYPIAKMLDFVSALMYASCEEKVTKVVGSGRNRREIQTAIYGGKYSTSSGVSEGGQLMIGLKYAFPAPKVTDDPDITKALKNEWRMHNSLQRPKGETQRVTQFPQHARSTMQPLPGQEEYWETQTFPGDIPGRERPIDFVTIQVVEDLEYFIGLGTKRGTLKDVTPADVDRHNWFDVLESFRQSHWTLEDQLGIAISDVNKNFEAIERVAKQSIDAVRREIETGLTSKGQPTQIALYYESNRGVDMMVSPSLPTSPTEEITEETPEDVANQIVTPVSSPVQTGITPQVSTQPQNQGLPVDVTQESAPELEDMNVANEENAAQPMLMNPNFVSKRRDQRQLLKQPPQPGKLSRSEVIDRMQKIADELDCRGFTGLSSKFDMLLKKILEG